MTCERENYQFARHRVFVLFNSGQVFSHFITICDETSAARCPVFPGVATRLHWSFPDPSSLRGTSEQIIWQTREIRDAIKEKIQRWCGEVCRSRHVCSESICY